MAVRQERRKQGEMEPRDQEFPSLRALLEEQRRLLAEIRKLLAQIDARYRLERGEDGLDG